MHCSVMVSFKPQKEGQCGRTGDLAAEKTPLHIYLCGPTVDDMR